MTTFKTLADMKFVSGLQASPGKKTGVFAVTTMDMQENSYKTDIYQLLADQDNQIKRLTAAGDVHDFAFTSDSKLIFAAARSKKEKELTKEGVDTTTFYELDLNGGEALPTFTLPFAVTSVEKLTDGRFLISVSQREGEEKLYLQTEEERLKKAKEHKKMSFYTPTEKIPFWENGEGYINDTYTRAFLFDPQKSDLCERFVPLLEEGYMVFDYELNKAKSKVLLAGGKYTEKLKSGESIWEYEIATGVKRQLLSESRGMSLFYAFYWQDGIFAFGTTHEENGLNEDPKLYRFDEASQKFELVLDRKFHLANTVGSDVEYGGSHEFEVTDDAIYAIETSWSRSVVLRIDKDLKVKPYAYYDGAISGFAFIGDNFYVHGLNDMRPTELYQISPLTAEKAADCADAVLATENAAKAPFLAWPVLESKKISNFNDGIVGKKPERFTFDSNGAVLEGFVILPDKVKATEAQESASTRSLAAEASNCSANADSSADATLALDHGCKIPVILDIHGGPKTAYGDVYFHEMQLWQNLGFAVIFTNPRGSDGRENDFSDIRGHYGDLDFSDIMNFVDAALARYPQLDKDRIGVTGGSYGGFMTNWIVSHTQRFKAAATQRSISNWLSFYGVSDIGYYFADDQNNTNIKAADFNEILWQHSPMKYVDNVKTPTLFIHASEDYRCPLEQGVQYYTALKDRGVEARLCIFHGENHELSRSGKPEARRQRLAEITCWFAKYLLSDENFIFA